VRCYTCEPLMSQSGQFATELSRQQVGPCPFCSVSDPILQPSEMSRSAITGREQSQHGIQLFDDLVGADQERFRNRQPETFRGPEIDHEFERRRLLHRYVIGTLTAK
jgi:hypothetical protein